MLCRTSPVLMAHSAYYKRIGHVVDSKILYEIHGRCVAASKIGGCMLAGGRGTFSNVTLMRAVTKRVVVNVQKRSTYLFLWNVGQVLFKSEGFQDVICLLISSCFRP